MNPTLVYCWKEWRAQRGLLISYMLLVFVCLSLGLYLAPHRVWFDEAFGTHALTWFVAAGVIGVVVFAAPGLVRGEYVAKDDQFVRRLPGALRPAFGGKLLFLVVVTIALPLLGLVVGQLFVTALGHNWDSLFWWQWNGRVGFRAPQVLVACQVAMLLMPWVWAVSMWTPGGRLAVMATVLLVLTVSFGVEAVFRQSPGIQYAIGYRDWLWSVPVSGLIVAAVSWLKGRRGGRNGSLDALWLAGDDRVACASWCLVGGAFVSLPQSRQCATPAVASGWGVR